ncbi:putative monooxygenase [Mycena polygramma]|nr:putative monooxygenase [Mycena polygramma]
MSYLLLLSVAIVCVAYFVKLQQAKTNLPPGPRRWPVIGCALEIPLTRQWLKFSQWADMYGDIVYLEALGKPFVILNSAKAAKALMDGRSSIYSDRPDLVMAKLAGYGDSFLIQSYGHTSRQQRKIIAREFGPNTYQKYCSLQECEARKLVLGVLNDPHSLADQTELRIGTLIIQATYGYYLIDEKDPFLTATLAALDNFSQAVTPGAWAVEYLPILRMCPTWTRGRGFLETARDWRSVIKAASWDPYLWESGIFVPPSLCVTALEAFHGREPSEEEERDLVWAASTVMGGGLDTNVSSILSFFLAMLCNRSIQEKAQREIDTVIGSDRLPVLSDRESLPYVKSVVAEVFRWRPVLPLGIPHALRQDDVYEGLHLPKGAQVVANVWHMLHDPEIYQNPTVFDPDRYQNNDAEMAKVTDLVFGFGRRACPGRYFGESTFFMVVATVLATCDIVPSLDSERDPSIASDVNAYSSGVITNPPPFGCDVKHRSEKALRLLSSD